MNKTVTKKIVATFTSVATVAMMTAGAFMPMAAGAAPTSISFAPPASYPIDGIQFATEIALADINHDGKTDIVTANFSGSISVLINNGDGTFGLKTDLPTLSSAREIATADLDGDGNVDVMTGNVNGNDSFFFGNGDGTFAPRVDYTIPLVPNQSFVSFHDIALADVNNDGQVDVVSAYLFQNSIAVRLNTGGRSFANPVLYPTGPLNNSLYHPNSVSIADINGDGMNDIVSGLGSAGFVQVHMNNGNGTFAAPVNYATESGSVIAKVADLNGDGRVDIVANAGSGSVFVLLNSGGGTFGTAVQYAGNPGGLNLALSDLNGDGKVDILTPNISGGGNQSFSFGVYPNNGDGTFAREIDTSSPQSLQNIAAADLNGDGKNDVVGAGTTAQVLVYLNTTGEQQHAGPGKILICHYPDGNPDNVQIIEVSFSALKGHFKDNTMDVPFDEETQSCAVQIASSGGSSSSSGSLLALAAAALAAGLGIGLYARRRA